jgi:hypothetical protein
MSPGINTVESIPPGWESIPPGWESILELLKRFSNMGQESFFKHYTREKVLPEKLIGLQKNIFY